MRLDTTAQNGILDNTYGPAAGAASPASFEVALFAGDPELVTGAELAADGGYARPVVTNAAMYPTPAAGGAKTSALVTFSSSTGTRSAVATHWVIFDAADSTTVWGSGRLTDDIPTVTLTPPSITCTVYHSQGV